MSLSATLFGTDSAIYKVTNVLGLGVPGLLNKWFGAKDPKDQVQRIGELASQSAKEGGARPIVWGRVRPISGNLMHCSTPRIVKVEVEGEDSGGGKGGGKKKAAKQYQERVYRTYAIRICEGPITGVIRIWRNNKLVYDARGNAWGTTNNGVFLRTFRFYLGGWLQMPDPALEGIWGAGNVPGYRGTCYMVAVDEDLTDMGGSVPQYVFEVERAEGVALTSRPYNIEDIERSGSQGVEVRPDGYYLRDAAAGGAISLEDGNMRPLLIRYQNWPADNTKAEGVAILSGGMVNALTRYDNWPPEEIDSSGFNLLEGVLRPGVIKYEQWPTESVNANGFEILGGELL